MRALTRRAGLALLHLFGLHTHREFADINADLDETVARYYQQVTEISEGYLFRAVMYGAALAHDPDLEPHLTGIADAVRSHARQFLNLHTGHGSGTVLADAAALASAIQAANPDQPQREACARIQAAVDALQVMSA